MCTKYGFKVLKQAIEPEGGFQCWKMLREAKSE
jgi:hypothetical protein